MYFYRLRYLIKSSRFIRDKFPTSARYKKDLALQVIILQYEGRGLE